MKKLKTRIGVLMLALTLVAGGAISVCAANVGGGVWDYGTKVSGVNEKTVYSNYYHPSKTHKSSVSIGTTAVTSGWVSAGTTSYASAKGSWNAETHAYYSCK